MRSIPLLSRTRRPAGLGQVRNAWSGGKSPMLRKGNLVSTRPDHSRPRPAPSCTSRRSPGRAITSRPPLPEPQLIQQSLSDLFDAIAEIAEAEQAPVHFYVYSRSEMSQLVEACTRGGSRLLSHLRELLGCR